MYDDDEPTIEIMMSMSPNEWRKFKRDYKKAYAVGFAQGLAQGLEKGAVIGIEIGTVLTLRANILTTIRAKFGKVPTTVSSRIKLLSNATQLSALFEQVLASKSLADVRAALER